MKVLEKAKEKYGLESFTVSRDAKLHVQTKVLSPRVRTVHPVAGAGPVPKGLQFRLLANFYSPLGICLEQQDLDIPN